MVGEEVECESGGGGEREWTVIEGKSKRVECKNGG